MALSGSEDNSTWNLDRGRPGASPNAHTICIVCNCKIPDREDAFIGGIGTYICMRCAAKEGLTW